MLCLWPAVQPAAKKFEKLIEHRQYQEFIVQKYCTLKINAHLRISCPISKVNNPTKYGASNAKNELLCIPYARIQEIYGGWPFASLFSR